MMFKIIRHEHGFDVLRNGCWFATYNHGWLLLALRPSSMPGRKITLGILVGVARQTWHENLYHQSGKHLQLPPRRGIWKISVDNRYFYYWQVWGIIREVRRVLREEAEKNDN